MEYLKICKEVFYDMFHIIIYTFINSLGHIINLMEISLPYVCLALGQYLRDQRGYSGIGGEVFLPVFVFFIIYFSRMFLNKIGKGSNIPTPTKRFTEDIGDGEIVIESDRLQELIIYLYDLEEWMSKNNMM